MKSIKWTETEEVFFKKYYIYRDNKYLIKIEKNIKDLISYTYFNFFKKSDYEKNKYDRIINDTLTHIILNIDLYESNKKAMTWIISVSKNYIYNILNKKITGDLKYKPYASEIKHIHYELNTAHQLINYGEEEEDILDMYNNKIDKLISEEEDILNIIILLLLKKYIKYNNIKVDIIKYININLGEITIPVIKERMKIIKAKL